MTLTIELPDEQNAALAARARAQGVSAEEYARQVLADDLKYSSGSRPIWDVIVDNMQDVPREAFASLPKDGASQVDHYLHGHPKRNP